MTMQALLARSLAQPAFGAGGGAALAALAVSLALVGVYGLFAFAVAQQRREIGVRLALGASPRDLVTGVLREGALVTLGGLIIGLSAAVPAAHLASARLGAAVDAGADVFAAVGLIMGAAALAACWIPARRAGRVEPAIVLRGD